MNTWHSWQGIHQIYGHIRCIYSIFGREFTQIYGHIQGVCTQFWPTIHATHKNTACERVIVSLVCVTPEISACERVIVSLVFVTPEVSACERVTVSLVCVTPEISACERVIVSLNCHTRNQRRKNTIMHRLFQCMPPRQVCLSMYVFCCA